MSDNQHFRTENHPPFKIFISYSHEDKSLKNELIKHLSLLMRSGSIDIWTDRKIGAGGEINPDIDRNLNSAHVILLLISHNFLSSDYCYEVEAKRAMERHDSDGTTVIPIILSPCDWKQAPFGKLEALPTDGKPITDVEFWKNPDYAFLDIANGIKNVIFSSPLAHESSASLSANVLISDTGTNLSEMNATFYSPRIFGLAQTVKFTPPRAGWKLERVLIVGTDGWNSSQKENPVQGIFSVEIRDATLKLLYQYADTQLDYFTSANGARTAMIDIPAIAMTSDFYVCFYGRDVVKTLTELQDSTGNSYYYIRDSGLLGPGSIPLKDNTTLPVNWIIRVVGE